LKTRKLLAMLVAVAVKLVDVTVGVTMLPVVAFANGTTTYSAAASYIVDYDDKADIGTDEDDEGAEIILRFRDMNGYKLDEGQSVYIWIESSRDAESIEPGVIGSGQSVQIGKNSEVKFVVKSGVPGKATISFYTGDPDGEGAEKGRLIDEAVIEFVTVKKDINVSLDAEYDGDKAVAGKRFSLIATVTDSSGWELDDEEVTFYERKGESGSFKSIGKAKTDRNGEAELKISREKADKYYYYAKVGSVNTKDDLELVEVVAAAPYSIEADKDVYYVDADKKEATVKFVVKDRYGNNVPDEDILEVVVIDPDGDDEEYDDSDDVFGVDKNNKITFTFDIDDEGEYEVEAKIKDTSISAETKVIVGEFGEVKEIKLELHGEDGKIDPAVIRSSSDDDIEGYSVVAKLIDEDGIEVDADDYGDEVVFSTNKPSLATVARYDGDLVVKEDAAGVVTITAVHLDSGVEASLDISIGGSPVDLLVDVSSEGLAADVTIAYVDEEGLQTYAVEGEDDEIEEVTDYQVIVPEGVEVIDQDEFEYGEAEFTLEAEEYGTYSVRVVTDDWYLQDLRCDLQRKGRKACSRQGGPHHRCQLRPG
jgi:hypothetical protein